MVSQHLLFHPVFSAPQLILLLSNAVRKLVRAACRCAIIVRGTKSHLDGHTVRCPQALILRHTIVSTVEAETGDARVSLYASGLLKTRSEIFGNLTEDTYLPLDNLLVRAGGHVTRHITDETLLGSIIKDLLPYSAREPEILRSDLRQEGNSLASEVTMGLVEVNRAVPERNWIDRRKVVWTRSLVIESHVSSPLEIRHPVGHARCIGWKLLVVCANTVTVSVGVGEETAL